MSIRNFTKNNRSVKFVSRINPYLFAIIVISLAALACSPLSNTQGYHVVSYILLFVVSLLATFLGIGPILLASTLSSLVWNFFFIPPHYTFHIDKTEDLLMFGMFFIIALLNGVLTTRVRRQEKLALEREERTNALFQLTKELSKASGIDEVLAVSIQDIKKYFQIDSFFVLQDGSNSLPDYDRIQEDIVVTSEDYDVAGWVFKHNQKAGKFTDRFESADYSFYPLHGTRLTPGVVALKQTGPLSGDNITFLEALLTQIGNALEREFLGELAQKAKFLDESDRLYKTLFNSISHELRIPVATILGAVDTLITSPHPGNVQTALFNEIFTASIRLNRLIENLLNMSRLESGRISVRKDWYDVNDLVNKVAKDLQDELKPFTFAISMPEEVPLVHIDFGLMEQVLYNLLFNSTEHAPAATEIRLNILHKNDWLKIEVMDQGPGFPREKLENVFRKFFKVDNRKTGGLGLGLSIVKGFVEAHQGSVSVENRKEGGTKFTILLPSSTPQITNLAIDS